MGKCEGAGQEQDHTFIGARPISDQQQFQFNVQTLGRLVLIELITTAAVTLVLGGVGGVRHHTSPPQPA